MRRARRLLVGLMPLAIGAAAAHCSVYDASLLDPDPNRPQQTNGVGWWSGPGDRGCFSASVPGEAERPAPAGDKAIDPIFLAVQSMRLGSLNEQGQPDPTAWQSIGFDLDGVCTGSDSCSGTDSPLSCKPTVPQVAIDGHYCRDNTFGRLEYTALLVPEIANKYGLSDDAFNCALCVGDYNFLLRLTGYNGEADDDRIRVDMYPSPGLDTPLPWNCADQSWKTHPCFTSEMPFTVQQDILSAPGDGPALADSKMFDDAAYVKDGYVVFRIPQDTLFWFPGYKALVAAYPLRFRDGIVTGKLSHGPDNVWRVTDGIIAGRTRGDDVVKGFRLMGFCEGDTNYELMTEFVKKNLDLAADGRNDPETTCDAMSVGIAFNALQAQAGKSVSVEPLVECERTGDAGDAGRGDSGRPSDASRD